jgi:hypothetical protein
VLFEFVTGRLAFNGDSDYSILDRIVRGHPEPFVHDDAAVVAQLRPIVSKSLAKDPADRYQNAELMARDLAEARRKLSDDESGTPTVFISRRDAPAVNVAEVEEPSPVAAAPAVEVTPPHRPTPEPPRRDPAVREAQIREPQIRQPQVIGAGRSASPELAAPSRPLVPRKFFVWAVPGALALVAGIWSLRPQPSVAVNPIETATTPPPVVAPIPDPAPPAASSPSTEVPKALPAQTPPDVPTKVTPTETAKQDRPVFDPRPAVIQPPPAASAAPAPAPPPVNYSARIAAARDAFENGDYTGALQRYEAILKEDPDNAEASRGMQAVRAAQAAESKVFSSTGTSAKIPIDINGRLAHARSRFEEGDYDAAIGAYEEVLKADPRNARAQSGLSEARKAKAAEDAILKRPPKKPGV